ncbi:HAD-like domain-containing protein [Coniochaeta sp. 2T2.1]|nr:HAD-like domain-containing protein [Coniochaeta sp. 2T2.1]
MKRFMSIMAKSTPKPRMFAPLRPGAGEMEAPKLQGVVFDVDGTLCEPQNYMFHQMRSVLSISRQTDILEHIYSLPPSAQESAMASIRAIEAQAMTLQTPQPGLVTLMTYLDSRSIRKGICTRNFDAPVNHLLSKFLSGSSFHPIVTRDFRPPKPDPAGILHIARSWGLMRRVGEGEEEKLGVPMGEEGKREGLVETHKGEEVADASKLIMVGDSIDDMTAGRRAGAATVLLVNDVNRHLADHEHTDLVIERLDELIEVLENGFVGRAIEEKV